jgi:hypothetical protein
VEPVDDVDGVRLVAGRSDWPEESTPLLLPEPLNLAVPDSDALSTTTPAFVPGSTGTTTDTTCPEVLDRIRVGNGG